MHQFSGLVFLFIFLISNIANRNVFSGDDVRKCECVSAVSRQSVGLPFVDAELLLLCGEVYWILGLSEGLLEYNRFKSLYPFCFSFLQVSLRSKAFSFIGPWDAYFIDN